MKKLLKVSMVAMLVAAPFAANAATAPVNYTDGQNVTKPTVTANTNVATTSFVQGAYNELAEAINGIATTAGNALTASDIATGTANGTIKVKGTDVSVAGLGTAAYTASTDYATAAQGAKADTAVQSVATGTAAGTISVDGTDVAVNGVLTDASAFATAAQGAKADTALQSDSALNGANLTAGTVAKTALASGVQTSLDKADSAIQASDLASYGFNVYGDWSTPNAATGSVTVTNSNLQSNGQ